VLVRIAPIVDTRTAALLPCRPARVEHLVSDNLPTQDAAARDGVRVRALVVGEVLWDVFPDATRLGGAALNFAVHLNRLGHVPRIVSAVGRDALGEGAAAEIESLGLDTTFLQSSDTFRTGTASVLLGTGDRTSFVIDRPAAYDAVEISDAVLAQVTQWKPSWCYYGTLFASRVHGRDVLRQLLEALPHARRFYDVNLRPGFASRKLVCDLLRVADVVKLNEPELASVREWLALPADIEGFCRTGAGHFGWQAVCVTLGARGCAMLVGDNYVEAPGVAVAVADTVGAGDAFAAAFVHGLAAGWSAPKVAEFSNHIGGMVASVQGAIPHP
jgi:fructokinase